MDGLSGGNLSSWNGLWLNGTGDATGFSTEGDYPDLTQVAAVRVAFIVVYLAVMLLALSGNLMVCYIVFSNRKMHTVVNYYIVNLAVCDLMVGAFVLPVKLLELTGPLSWTALNDGLCTALTYLQTIFVFASVLTLVATCLERYFAILHPLESRMQQSKARAKRILLAVWLTPCTIALPFLYPSTALEYVLSSHLGTIERQACYTPFPEYFRMGYYTFLFVFIYLIPLSFIGGTCLRIARCLLRGISFHRQGSLRRQENNRRKVAKMIMVVVVAFGVSWTPYFVVSIVTQYQPVNFLENHNYFFTMLCINLCGFLNSCVNPFIYAAMSSRFRNGFRRILRFLMCRGRPYHSPGIRGKTRPGCVRGPDSHNRQMSIYANETLTPNTSDSASQSESGGSVQQTALHMGSFRSVRSLVGCISMRRKSVLDHCRLVNGLCATVPTKLRVKVPDQPSLPETVRRPSQDIRCKGGRVRSDSAVPALAAAAEEGSPETEVQRSRSCSGVSSGYRSDSRGFLERLLYSSQVLPCVRPTAFLKRASFPCKVQTEFSVIRPGGVQCSALGGGRTRGLGRSTSAPSVLLARGFPRDTGD